MQATHRALPSTEISRPRASKDYATVLRRLSVASVNKHFDAYTDIAWDDPSYAVDVRDPRWAYHNFTDDTLTGTRWYLTLPPEEKSRLGLHVAATFAKVGIEFESILQRGLLTYAYRLPNGSPEFRYAYHEVIEEGQHSLMFQEFINRSGLDVTGMPMWFHFGGRGVIELAMFFPELFFLFVLGGEEPIDYVQRQGLRRKEAIHPLLRRLAEIHITEEARHISFARTYLRERVPALTFERKLALAISTPMLLGRMTPLMLRPSKDTVKAFDIPKEAWAEAYENNPEYSEHLAKATEKVRRLCEELDLMPAAARELWKRVGVTD
jgi:hypothetical protein